MTDTYSFGLVALSLLVAILASYTALDLAKRIGRIQASGYRHFWLIGGALAMGVGIWAMHFIGMLAFHMPIKMGYDLWITLLSLAIAVVVSWFALYLATMKKLSLTHLLAGGVLMGMGIAVMHYTGMAAMAIHPAMSHDPWLFTTSVLIAITASIVALWMTFSLRADGRQYAFTRKIAADGFRDYRHALHGDGRGQVRAGKHQPGGPSRRHLAHYHRLDHFIEHFDHRDHPVDAGCAVRFTEQQIHPIAASSQRQTAALRHARRLD